MTRKMSCYLRTKFGTQIWDPKYFFWLKMENSLNPQNESMEQDQKAKLKLAM